MAGGTIKRSFITPRPGRRSDICDINQAAGWRRVEDPYPSGHLSPPFHPRCRCWQEVN
jgi:hypothetical protein